MELRDYESGSDPFLQEEALALTTSLYDVKERPLFYTSSYGINVGVLFFIG